MRQDRHRMPIRDRKTPVHARTPLSDSTLPGRLARLTVAASAGLAVAAVLLTTGCASIDGAGAQAPAVKSGSAALHICAASSLKDVLEATAPEFESAKGVELVFNFAASGVLQRQIEAGAPADAFVSASPKQVDALVSAGLISGKEISTFAGNDLVILVPKGNPAQVSGPADLAKADRIVTGNPDTAPHGTKAREWLEGLGLWRRLQRKFVFAENAAQTLDYVARGEVDAGIGFGSEATGNDAVEAVYTVPAGETEPVRYVAAPLADAVSRQLAVDYVSYLDSPAVQRALASAGFLPAPK